MPEGSRFLGGCRRFGMTRFAKLFEDENNDDNGCGGECGGAFGQG